MAKTTHCSCRGQELDSTVGGGQWPITLPLGRPMPLAPQSSPHVYMCDEESFLRNCVQDVKMTHNAAGALEPGSIGKPLPSPGCSVPGENGVSWASWKLGW